MRRFAKLGPGMTVSEKRMVTESDVEAFARLTGDVNPVHFGPSAVVHGVLLNGLVSCVLGTRLPGPGYVVVQQSMTFPNACRVGESVLVFVEVTNARKIVECRYVCTRCADGKVVHEGLAKLVLRRD